MSGFQWYHYGSPPNRAAGWPGSGPMASTPGPMASTPGPMAPFPVGGLSGLQPHHLGPPPRRDSMVSSTGSIAPSPMRGLSGLQPHHFGPPPRRDSVVSSSGSIAPSAVGSLSGLQPHHFGPPPRRESHVPGTGSRSSTPVPTRPSGVGSLNGLQPHHFGPPPKREESVSRPGPTASAQRMTPPPMAGRGYATQSRMTAPPMMGGGAAGNGYAAPSRMTPPPMGGGSAGPANGYASQPSRITAQPSRIIAPANQPRHYGPPIVDSEPSTSKAYSLPSSAYPPPATSTKNTEYGVGILWLCRKNKLLVAGFAPGSLARTCGVKAGDILKSVDGRDVLGMTVDKRTGKHEAGILMGGTRGSECKLELLRVPPGSDATTALQHVVVNVPRVLPTESFDTQHY